MIRAAAACGCSTIIVEMQCKISDQHPGRDRTHAIGCIGGLNKKVPEAFRWSRGSWLKSIYFQGLDEQIEIAFKSINEILKRLHLSIYEFAFDETLAFIRPLDRCWR